MDHFIITGFADEIHEQLDIQCQTLQHLGINHMEIRGVNGRNITSYSLEEIDEIKSELDHYHIDVSAIGSPIGKVNIHDAFDNHLILFKHTIQIAKKLETRFIRLFSFYIPEGGSYDEYRGEVIPRLKLFTQIAVENDIILLHENEKDIYGDIPSRCLDLVKQVNNPHFKLIFDFANFIQCNVKPLEAYELLKDYVVYFHIKDAVIKTKQVVPPGYGDGHLYDILKQAYNNGYRGFLSVEPHLGHFKGLQDLELNIKLEDYDDNGIEKFTLAYRALETILNDIK